MPHVGTGWHSSMLLSSDTEARQKITLLFVITIKCFILWLKMGKSTMDRNLIP